MSVLLEEPEIRDVPDIGTEETPPQIEAAKPKAILQGSAVSLPDVELWPEAVNGADTLNKIAETFDRSIVIRLERAKPGELKERFDSRRVDREKELCRKLARFVADNAARLEACDPVLPAGAFNRLADNWRPLFAVAEIAGGDWPQRAADAFAKLNGQDDADAQGIGTMLLADIRQAFAENRAERIFSKSLVETLCAMTDRPWLEAHKAKPITETWLAHRLRAFGISSRTLRIGDNRAKGYELADFTEAFERYLPAGAIEM